MSNCTEATGPMLILSGVTRLVFVWGAVSKDSEKGTKWGIEYQTGFFLIRRAVCVLVVTKNKPVTIPPSPAAAADTSDAQIKVTVWAQRSRAVDFLGGQSMATCPKCQTLNAEKNSLCVSCGQAPHEGRYVLPRLLKEE